MNQPDAPVSTTLTVKNLSTILQFPVRWQILQLLSNGQALPANLIAKTIGISAGTTSKHLNIMRRNGALTQGLGRLYTIAPAFRPAPGSDVLDFGPCLLRVPRATPPA
jgi:Helix-turn-helix domain